MPINPDKPALTQSDYDRFDFAYAKDLKDNYPKYLESRRQHKRQ